MVVYPIYVPRDGYSGQNESRKQKSRQHNIIAKEIEDYLNAKIAASDQEIQQFMNYQISRDINRDIEDVSKILFKVDCGHNGLTVVKPKA